MKALLKHLNINNCAIIILFSWISLFPATVQLRYQAVVNSLLLLAFIYLWSKKGSSIFRPSDFPLLIFIFVITLNIFFAKEKVVAWRTYLNIAVPLCAIYYLVPEGSSNEEYFPILVKAISIFSILVALLGIIECFFRFNPLYVYFINNPYYARYMYGFARPMSTQLNPAVLGSYLNGCLPFNFILFKQNRGHLKFLGAVGLVLSVPLIILTFSRSAFLGLVAMVASYLFFKKRLRLLAIFVIILFIFILICTYLPWPIQKIGINLMTTIWSADRLNRYVMVQRIIKEHPMIGLGFQHFRIRFYEYYPGKYNVSYETMIADNMYLTILSETGLIGAVGFLVFIFSLFWKAGKKVSALSLLPHKRQEAVLVLISFIGLLVNMIGYEFFYWPNPYMFFCILIGLIEANYRSS